jgi:hypothetical protein
VIPPRNSWYRAALAGPHEAYSRVEVWRAGVKVEELAWRGADGVGLGAARNVPVFFGGSIRATFGSQVTRTMSLTVPRYLFPRATTDLLSPYGNELRAFRGIRYGNSSPDEFPVFVGPILRVKPPNSTSATIEASDNSFRVAASAFSAPAPSQSGTLVTDEFERLVKLAYPPAIFGTHSPLTELVPVLAYDTDPGSALDSLAKTANAYWYTLADGRYVIRRVPWTVLPSSGSIVLTDGPGGTVLDAYPDRNATQLYNRFTVTSERPDGGTAFYASAQDNDPTSPTYVSGPYGLRAAPVIRVTGADSQQQLLALAEQLIARTRVLTDSWSITCVPDASIELGDPLDVTAQGDRAAQVAAGFTMPLDPNGTMTIDGRGISSSAEAEV